MGALGSTGDRPEARDSTTSTDRGAGGTTGARSERRGWARGMGRSEKQTKHGGRMRGDGCGGKCEGEQMDERTAPCSVQWVRKWVDILERDVGDVRRRRHA
jgi:hypothetical protein